MTMDYEKKYKDALQRAKHALDCDRNNLVSTDVPLIYSMFPELKESEDEQIRKLLVEAVTQVLQDQYCSNRGVSKEKVVAWLEKQGEQKPIIEMKSAEESLGIDSDTYNKIVDECIYGEQKPVDKVEPKFKVKYAGSEYNVLEVKDIAGVTFYGIEDEPNHIDYVKADNCEIISGYGIKESGLSIPTKPVTFSEKKPQRMISAEAKEAMYAKSAEWSEEDEKIFNKIIQKLDKSDNVSHYDYADFEMWLIDLKERLINI